MTIGIPHETRKQQNDRVSKQAAAHQLILAFFAGDEKKTIAWFTTPNPLLGNVEPLDLIRMGQADKVLRFVKTQLAQNEPPMAMTDAEAKKLLEGRLTCLLVGYPPDLQAALTHAVRAINDREALVSDAGSDEFDEARNAARRHMHGEE